MDFFAPTTEKTEKYLEGEKRSKKDIEVIVKLKKV